MIPQSYRTQDGCYNCKHAFILFEYDCSDEYFCTKDGTKRPKCGSIAMNNEEYDYNIFSEKEILKQMDDWNNWQSSRQVKPYGICNSHEYKGK